MGTRNLTQVPYTEGFFFGKSYPEDKMNDMEFITKARKAINEGYDIFFYRSWW